MASYSKVFPLGSVTGCNMICSTEQQFNWLVNDLHIYDVADPYIPLINVRSCC